MPYFGVFLVSYRKYSYERAAASHSHRNYIHYVSKFPELPAEIFHLCIIKEERVGASWRKKMKE